MNIHIYWFILFTLFASSCKTKKNTVVEIAEQVKINILNEYVMLPPYDSIPFTDTILFEIVNTSNFDYIHYTFDSTFFFYNKGNVSIHDRLDGDLGCIFMDENKKTLESYGYCAFNPEGFDNYILEIHDPKIEVLKAQDTISLKALLTFPNEHSFGNILQFNDHLNECRFIEIVFKPAVGGFEYSLETGKLKLKPNQKILKLIHSQTLPVKIINQNNN